MRDIAEHIVEALGAGHDVVLVTVVGSRGSTPRNAGSQMLVSKAGLVCGTIGGGAIEGHAIAEARTMVGKDVCRVEDLALRPQAENSIGMVCGGDAVLLYVPICAEDDAWTQVASQLLKCFERRTPAYLALECREGCLPFKGTVVGQEACRLEAEACYRWVFCNARFNSHACHCVWGRSCGSCHHCSPCTGRLRLHSF